MALTFEYQCNGCHQVKTNHELESFGCDCGGSFVMIDSGFMDKVPYDEHDNEYLGKRITSWTQMEKECKRHVSPDHPKGFKLRESDSKVMKEMEFLRKNKEEIHQETYRRDGIHHYKRGSNTNFHEKTGTFVPRGTHHAPERKRQYFYGS